MTHKHLNEYPRVIQIIIAAGALAVAITAIMVPTVWALDTRYVTAASVEQSFLTRDIRDIRRSIRKLEYLKSNNLITDAELWELEGLRDELEELKEYQVQIN